MKTIIELWPVIAAISSIIGAMLLSYLKLRHELEFIKGQLTQLMEFKDDLRLINAQIIDIKTNTDKNSYDLKNSFDKIRRLENECSIIATSKHT